MKVSAKAEYACLAVLELAMSYSADEPVRIKRIADAHGIPQGFLVQIMQQLKATGYVSSTRGAAGGYQLRRSPETISLGDVLVAIDGSKRLDYDLASSRLPPALRILRTVWSQVHELSEGVLHRTTFADLVEQAREQTAMPVVGDWI